MVSFEKFFGLFRKTETEEDILSRQIYHNLSRRDTLPTKRMLRQISGGEYDDYEQAVMRAGRIPKVMEEHSKRICLPHSSQIKEGLMALTFETYLPFQKEIICEFATCGSDYQLRGFNRWTDFATRSDRTINNIAFDGHYGITLEHNVEEGTRVLGLASFTPEEGAIKIVQIQGVKGAQKFMKGLRWEKALVASVCRWAKEYGVPEVRIQPAAKNQWKEIRDNEEGRGRLRYDVTAERMGFRYDPEMEMFRFSLSES